MSKVHLFGFGFERPEECEINQRTGTDFESAGFFKIVAESEEEAMEWGRILARWFVNKLYDEPGDHWAPENFAHWIEHRPDEHLLKFIGTLPVIAEGEYPEFEAVKALFKC